MNYIFDVDGTLTPSRLPIDINFESFFLHWMKGKNVYLVTGSDKDKTIEQVGEEIWMNATRCYQSCGNAVYEKGKLIRQLEFPLDEDLHAQLEEFLDRSNWKFNGSLYSNNIETRIGLINFSTIGRNCPQEAREQYAEWDKDVLERETFCRIINDKFPELEASVGGQISIDIHPKGKNKAQVLEDIEYPITFFGDKCQPGGNDYPIVESLEKKYKNNLNQKLYDNCYTVHEVESWKDTRLKLMSTAKLSGYIIMPNGNVLIPDLNK